MVVREVLDNGLVVLVDERPTADTVALQLVARAGTRDDGPDAGLTALTSRLMFQGTGRRPSETELQRVAAAVGGGLSRGTFAESSAFSAAMPAREAATGFDLLADLVVDPLLTDSALARQQQIAIQELARQRADPGSVMDDLYRRTVFAGHPLASPPLGTAETVPALSTAAIRAHRERFWSASNLVLAVAGKITPAEAMAVASGALAALPAGAPNSRAPALPPAPVPGEARETAGQQQAQFRLVFLAPDLGSADRYPFGVMNALTAGASGRLFEEVRNVRGLAYTAGSAYSAFSDAGTWFAAAGVDPQNLAAAVDVVRAEVQRLLEGPPDAGEVDLRISQFAGQQILAAESNTARAGQLIGQELFGTPPSAELVARIRQVRPDDVWRVARTYIDPTRAVLIVVSPP